MLMDALPLFVVSRLDNFTFPLPLLNHQSLVSPCSWIHDPRQRFSDLRFFFSTPLGWVFRGFPSQYKTLIAYRSYGMLSPPLPPLSHFSIPRSLQAGVQSPFQAVSPLVPCPFQAFCGLPFTRISISPALKGLIARVGQSSGFRAPASQLSSGRQANFSSPNLVPTAPPSSDSFRAGNA